MKITKRLKEYILKEYELAIGTKDLIIEDLSVSICYNYIGKQEWMIIGKFKTEEKYQDFEIECNFEAVNYLFEEEED